MKTFALQFILNTKIFPLSSCKYSTAQCALVRGLTAFFCELNIMHFIVRCRLSSKTGIKNDSDSVLFYPISDVYLCVVKISSNVIVNKHCHTQRRI